LIGGGLLPNPQQCFGTPTLPACRRSTLPDGRELETLADCRAYILALPAKEHARWEGVVAMLLNAAEQGGGWRFIARVSFSNALHGVSGVEPPPTPRRQERSMEGEASREKTAMSTVWI
jgi:hypothetical protein